LLRRDLVARAIDLGRMLRLLMPDEPEVRALLALMLLTDSRRDARVAADGSLVLLEDQNRTRWDVGHIDEGLLLVDSIGSGRPGRFALQAAIAAVHARAVSWEETDWRLILHLYDALLVVWPSPVVALNRVVAVLMVSGPAAALSEVEALEADDRLAGYRYLAATKADLLRRLGRDEEAAVAYGAAIELTDNETERGFLRSRLATVSGNRLPPSLD
jgi:RNA polymerase sigma-70 factor (ECF subfamily)